ncbi:MAG: hypothetical protein H6822_34285 [Planctomycetaceae bacterium]|nr:hypothetical protein [Planctomycetales bacterium]MCB9927255.1 hypothetical protein [Planctomycetaceae bacterium]
MKVEPLSLGLLAVAFLAGALCIFEAHGEDESNPVTPKIDRRLLEGLDEPPPLRTNPASDIAGEDLGAAQPKSTLAGLARLMQSVEHRIRRSDLSAETTQLQQDIASELAKMMETAEQENARRSAAAASDQSSTQAGRDKPDGTEGEPRTQTDDDSRYQTDLEAAIWGRLPARFREQIQTPLQEEYLPRYERVIKQYYKRLAEEQRRLRN